MPVRFTTEGSFANVFSSEAMPHTSKASGEYLCYELVNLRNAFNTRAAPGFPKGKQNYFSFFF
jgi:hypothetical protein